MKLPQILAGSHRKPLLKTALPGFDEVYYRYWYRDVAAAGVDPLAHYLRIGWREGRDPSAGFSTDGYLLAHDDVRETDQNPLLHFLEFGLAEGRSGWQKQPDAPAPRPQLPGHLQPQLRLTGPKES